MLTPEEFKANVQILITDKWGDVEKGHFAYDELLEKTLRELGYHEGVDLAAKQRKWFA